MSGADKRSGQAERLARFFTDWRTADTAPPTAPLAVRLERLFASLRDQARPDSQQETQPVPTLRPEALIPVFDVLRAPLAAAKANGAHLNAWTAAGLKRDEVRNAAVLATLLDPALCPATGPAFLLSLIGRSRLDDARLLTAERVAAGYTVRTEECPLGDGRNRVDICIEGLGFLLFIEVKIDAAEGLMQLGRYDEVLRKKAHLVGKTAFLFYLSPRAPADPPPDAAHLTWSDVAAAGRQASRSSGNSITQALLHQFAIHVSAFTDKPNAKPGSRSPARQQSA